MNSFPQYEYNLEALGGTAVDGLRTTLTSAVTTSSTTIYVVDTSNFPDGTGYAFISIGAMGTTFEVIRYRSKTSTSFTCLAGDRGVGGTTSAHNIGDFVRLDYNASVHNRGYGIIADLQEFSGKDGRIGLRLQAAEDISQYEAVTVNSAKKFVKTNIEYLETSRFVGLALYDIPRDETGIAVEGTVVNSNWAWTPQKEIWLSVTNGGLSETRPVSGKYGVCVGFSMDETSVLFKVPYYPFIAIE